jgi:hypothetical protein
MKPGAYRSRKSKDKHSPGDKPGPFDFLSMLFGFYKVAKYAASSALSVSIESKTKSW